MNKMPVIVNLNYSNGKGLLFTYLVGIRYYTFASRLEMKLKTALLHAYFSPLLIKASVAPKSFKKNM